MLSVFYADGYEKEFTSMPRSSKVKSLAVNYKAVFKGKSSRTLIGQVERLNEHDDSRRVTCLRLSLDPYLLKYWNAKKHFWAEDKHGLSQAGDIVLINQLKSPQSQYVTHRIAEVIFKNGAVVDPLTGRLCAGPKYADDVKNPKLDAYLRSKSIESEV